jgi:hypothetical protein
LTDEEQRPPSAADWSLEAQARQRYFHLWDLMDELAEAELELSLPGTGEEKATGKRDVWLLQRLIDVLLDDFCSGFLPPEYGDAITAKHPPSSNPSSSRLRLKLLAIRDALRQLGWFDPRYRPTVLEP